MFIKSFVTLHIVLFRLLPASQTKFLFHHQSDRNRKWIHLQQTNKQTKGRGLVFTDNLTSWQIKYKAWRARRSPTPKLSTHTPDKNLKNTGRQQEVPATPPTLTEAWWESLSAKRRSSDQKTFITQFKTLTWLQTRTLRSWSSLVLLDEPSTLYSTSAELQRGSVQTGFSPVHQVLSPSRRFWLFVPSTESERWSCEVWWHHQWPFTR